jgi:hypothetical protein
MIPDSGATGPLVAGLVTRAYDEVVPSRLQVRDVDGLLSFARPSDRLEV